MTETQIALLRGINVGRAKRVAMADLRALLGELGYEDVGTLLNSGNVVFTGEENRETAARIQAAIAEQLGVSCKVMVLSASDLSGVVRDNPLLDVADDPSRLQVAFLYDSADRAGLEALLGQDWSPEAMALGERAVYLWCPNGLSQSRLAKAVGDALADRVTTRTWNTVLKLHALAEAKDDGRPTTDGREPL